MARFGHLISLALAVSSAEAFWRLQCFGVVARGRIDPIVSPGKVSGHVHAVHGASGFSNSATVDDLLKSDCTSCQVDQDRSAYWEPQLYFMYTNGTVAAVEETAGHLTYYKYTPCYTSKGELKQPEAMPNGLRMISGDPFRRNFTLPVPDPPLPWSGKDATQDALQQKAIGFNCLNYGKAPEPSLYRHYLPDKDYMAANCPDGIRAEVLFPYCWNGQLDSPDHKSHLAFPDANLNGGKCPPGYDRVINQLFFETIYPVQNFAHEDGKFVFAMGDPTGYGMHGDALIAWKDDSLKQATAVCGPLSGPDASGVITDCPLFKVLDQGKQQQCTIPKGNSMSQEEVMSNLSKLPGNNPLQYGPQEASKNPGGGSDSGSGGAKPPPSPSVPYTSATTAAYTDALGNIYLHNNPKPTQKPDGAPADGKVLTTIWSTKGGTAYGEVVIEKVKYVTKMPEPSKAASPPGKSQADKDQGKVDDNMHVHQREVHLHQHQHAKRMKHAHGHGHAGLH